MDFMTEMFYGFHTNNPDYQSEPWKDPEATKTVNDEYVIERNGYEYGRVSLSSVAATTIRQVYVPNGDNPIYRIEFPDWRYIPKYTNTSENTQLVTLGIHPNNIINGTLWYTNVKRNPNVDLGETISSFFAPMIPYQAMLIKPLSSSQTVPSENLNGEFGILTQREISSFSQDGSDPKYKMSSGVYELHPTAFLDLEKSDSTSSYWYVFRYHYPGGGYNKKDSIAGPGQPILLSSGESVLFYQPHRGNNTQYQKDISAIYPTDPLEYPGYLSIDQMKINTAYAENKTLNVHMVYGDYSTEEGGFPSNISSLDGFCSLTTISCAGEESIKDRYVGKIMTVTQISENEEEMYNNVYKKSLIYWDANPESYFIRLSDYVQPAYPTPPISH